MPINPTIKAKADHDLVAYCEAKIPAHLRDKIRLSVKWRGSTVTIIEHRPYFLDPTKWTDSPIAQIRFDSESGRWSLFCRDRNQKWHSFSPMQHSVNLQQLISEIDRDQTGIFWG